jgi:hypothetical protein
MRPWMMGMTTATTIEAGTPCHHHLFMLISSMLFRAGLTKNKMTVSMLLSPCHQERI